MDKAAWKKYLILAFIGGMMGVAICFFMSVMSKSNGTETAGAGTVVLYYVVSFLHGAICMGTTFVYEIDQWSIARCTVTHFLIVLTCFYILGTVQGWLKFFSLSFWIITGGFVVAYFIVWMIMYLGYRKEIRRMNEGIKKIK